MEAIARFQAIHPDFAAENRFSSKKPDFLQSFCTVPKIRAMNAETNTFRLSLLAINGPFIQPFV